MSPNDRPKPVRDLVTAVVAGLKARRLALGISGEELGGRAGLGGVYIAMLESGRIEPTLYSCARIKAVLDEVDGVSMKAVRELRDLQRQMAIWRVRLERSRERIARAEGPLRGSKCSGRA